MRDHFISRKSLGQHFLVNPHVVRRIMSSCELHPADIILEIGPGKGALTHALSPHVKTVIAVEKDGRLAERLKREFQHTNVNIVHADILHYPFDALPDNMKIIGNLPYNIATPVIEKVFHYRKKFYAFFMTVQLEYGRRITAKPGTKSYGSFSCFVQFYASAQILFQIRNSAFQPAPKVQSCFLRLDLLREPKYKAVDEGFLFRIIRSCFGQRRKTIQNSLSGALGKEEIPGLLRALKIDPKWRAEDLGLEAYVRISEAADKMLRSHPSL